MTVLLLVFLTIIFSVTVDYFIQRRKKIAVTAQVQANNLSLPKIAHMVPAGVFLQPSFTWSKILDTGNIMLGIHPVLMGLIGEPDMVETLQQGEKVNKGETLIRLHRDSKELQVKAPVAGTILAINPDFDDASWENMGKSWLYGIRPENISSEIPNWFIAEKSRDWLDEIFQQIKTFFIQSLSRQQMGLTMADGGELPLGVLSEFDKKTWRDFENRFFN
jgi:glycine cleavage system H lipoate-binding protein